MNRIRIILRDSDTLHEMLIGLLFSNLLILILGMIFSRNKISALIGVLVGFVVAVFYTVHMAVTLDDAMCLDEKGAASQLRKNMLIRYAVVCGVVAIVSYFELCNPVLCIFSILTVKMGAYLQPLVHKYFTRSTEGGSESGGEISE